VLGNLVDNALKYSQPELPVEIKARMNGEEVFISVSDRGIGIPAPDLEHIFEKFYRVHRPENISGTGLGLSINKGIVEAHRGRIWAEKRPGGGTTITFTLPKEDVLEEER
jgi:two-component system sensor histidine kinase KdpD